MREGGGGKAWNLPSREHRPWPDLGVSGGGVLVAPGAAVGAAAAVGQQGQGGGGGSGGGGGGGGGRVGHGLLAGVALQLGLDARPAAITNAGGGVLRLVAEAPAGLRLVHAHARGHGDVGQPPAKFTGFFRLDTSGLTSASTAAKSASSSTSARCLMPPPRGRCLALPPSLRVRTRSQRPRLSQWSHRNLRRMPLIWYCAATEEPRTLTHRSVEALAALR